MPCIALINGAIYPGTAPNATQGVLLLSGSRVVGVFGSLDAARAKATSHISVMDITGMTALPGLIDCHVHLFFSGGHDMVTNMSKDVADAASRAAAHLRNGVTTVRDLGAPVPEIFELRRRISSGEVLGPRILAAGPLLTVPGGHGEFVGLTAVNGRQLREMVPAVAEQGSDCVKIAVSGGVSTPGSDLYATQFSEDDLRGAVDIAHELGLPVAAHASNAAAVRAAARAGVDSIEHAVMLDQSAIDALQDSAATLVPTLTPTDLTSTFFEDQRIPGYIREKARIVVPRHRESIRMAIEAGIPMVAGTDAGTTATAHGLAGKEAGQLTKCGLSNEHALAAVTRNAARVLGIADDVGTLEPGKAADVTVVAGNPLEEVKSLCDVRLVIKNGNVAFSSLG